MLNKIYYLFFIYVVSAAQRGRLVIELPDGKRKVFGAITASVEMRIKVTHVGFFKKVIRDAGIGLGESYTEGFWETAHLTPVLNFLILNKKYFDARLRPFKRIGHFVHAIKQRLHLNTLEESCKNIEGHDDLSNDFFALWLDSSMTYSCAVFQEQGETLEQAQENKIRRVIENLKILKTDHVLEIGCGWGAFAIQAARETGCRWTGLTLSKEQKKWAEEQVFEMGLQDQIQIQLMDYRQAEGQFDKIVSIEMIETVGHEFLKGFFKQCSALLKPGGKMVLQSVVIPNESYADYRKNCDWLQKYIFLGGHLPSLKVIEQHCRLADLKMGAMDRIGSDYAKTFAIWCAALLKNKSRLIEMGYKEAFIRKWQYYFCYCEAGFLADFLDDIQIYLQKPL